MSSKSRKKRKRDVYEDSDSKDESDSNSDDSSDEKSDSDSDSDSGSGSDSDRKSQKKKKHKKKKKKKKAKKDKKKKKKDKKKLKAARKLLAHSAASASLTALTSGSRSSEPTNYTTISIDDYFIKADEFRVWLTRANGLYLTDLDTKTARKYFKKFVKKWNGRELEDAYYRGINHTRVESSNMSRHKWKFASKMTEDEKNTLDTMRDSVDTDTFHKNHLQKKKPRRPPGPSMNPRAPTGPMRPEVDAHTREENRNMEYKELKYQRKNMRKHNKMVMEELVPKETGREARIEARKQKGAYARQEKDSGMVAMSDSDMMGGGVGTDFQRMMQRREQRFARKVDEKNRKASEYQQKEKDRMTALLSSLGMQNRFPDRK